MENKLLIRRCKVMLNYPDSKFNIGEILSQLSEDNGNFNYYFSKDFRNQICDIDKYPDIFKKLLWWQERKKEDMPEYLYDKDLNIYIKVIEYSYDENANIKSDFIFHNLFNTLYDCIPATEEQYKNYLNNKKI